MVFNRAHANLQAFGNLRIGQTLCKGKDNFAFASGPAEFLRAAGNGDIAMGKAETHRIARLARFGYTMFNFKVDIFVQG